MLVTDKYEVELPMPERSVFLLLKYCSITANAQDLILPQGLEENDIERGRAYLTEIPFDDDLLLALKYLGLQDTVISSINTIITQTNSTQSKPITQDNIRDQLLAFTRNTSPFALTSSLPASLISPSTSENSPPPSPPPINRKRHLEGYYEYNEDILYD